MELSIIPKPVLIDYKEGVYNSNSKPLLKKKETDLSKLPEFYAAGKLINEAYRLIISADDITLEASSPTGFFNGEQTFRQLLLLDEKLILPCAEIIDYPNFSWRGFLLDCSRYFYSVPFIKKLINVLALHHINRFHWHLTDDQGWRLPVKEYPLLTEIGSRRLDRRFPDFTYTAGFYTEDDIQEIVKYAAEHCMEVIPEVDLPGHTSAILASYPELGCTGGPYRVEDRFGIFEDVLCAGNEKILDLFEKIFDTLSRLFPSEWVHIGGDEVLFNRWNECPKCQKKLKELGLEKPSELQSWITTRLVQMLSERGKTAIGWDEILEDSHKFKLPKETIVMSWRGKEGGLKASAYGHNVIMSPNTEGCYLDYRHLDEPEEIGRTHGVSTVYSCYSMNPVTAQMNAEQSSRVLGGQCNLWSEVIYAGKIAEYMSFPRVCALAEAVWTAAEHKDFDDFSRRLMVHQKRLDKLGINQYRGALR